MTEVGGKKGGKSLAHRTRILAAAADGQHVHVGAKDGLWCVRATGIGPLWRKIRQPCPDGICQRYAYGKPGIRL